MTKKIITQKEEKKKEVAKNLELCSRPFSKEKKFVKITQYMLHHPKYISLSLSSKVALLYMLDWATSNSDFWYTGKFEYSYSMLENMGIMSKMQSVRCFKELREKGFIDIRIKEGKTSTNQWSFSNRWYTGKKESYTDSIW